MKKIIALMLALVMLFSLAACADRDDADDDEKEEKVEKEEKDEKDEGGAEADISIEFSDEDDEDDEESRGDEDDKDDRPVEVQRPEYLILTDVYYEPFEFTYEGSGEYTGFDIDIMELAAEYENFDVTFSPIAYELLFDELLEGEADAAIAAITKTSDREMLYDFSDAYFTDGIAAVINNDSSYKKMSDLNGEVIGCVVGSYAEGVIYDEMEALGITADVQTFEDYDAMYDALEAGKIDAALEEYSIAAWRIQNRGYDMALLSDVMAEQSYYLIVPKGENGELIESFNRAVDDMKNETGEYYQLMVKYGFHNFVK